MYLRFWNGLFLVVTMFDISSQLQPVQGILLGALVGVKLNGNRFSVIQITVSSAKN